MLFISVPWSSHMLPPWKTNNAKALLPKLSTLLPTSQRRDPCRNRDVSVGNDPRNTIRLFASAPDLVSDMFDLTVDGKLEDARPSLLSKLMSSNSVPELGHSSGSEGEKEFAPPEWDVPISKSSLRKTRSQSCSIHQIVENAAKVSFLCSSPHTEADSLQQISLQTLNADPFLKRAATTGACSPPPTSPTSLSRGTYSSVLNYNRYPAPHLSQHDSFTGFNIFNTSLTFKKIF